MLYKDVKIALQPVPLPSRGHLPSKSRLSDPFKCIRRISNSSKEPSRTYVSPVSPHCYKLFVVAKKLNSFGINQIQTLLQKHPGWGIPSGSKPPASSLQTEPPAPRIGQNHASSITQPSHQHHPLSASHRRRTAMPLPSQRPFLRALPSPRCDRASR